MKKIISMAMAASMVASMAVTAFARETVAGVDPIVDKNSELYIAGVNKDNEIVVNGFAETAGKSIAVKVDYEGVKPSDMHKYKAFFQASVGADVVTDVELGYYKYENAENANKPAYDWFVIINLDSSAEYGNTADIVGKVTIAKTAQQAKDNFNGVNHKEISYVELDYASKHENHMIETNQEVEDFEFEAASQQAMLLIDTTGIKKFDGNFTTKMNEVVWNKFSEPDYELFFYNWPCEPKFNRTGSLYFYSDEVSFKDFHVYEIVDAKTGELSEVPAHWDEEEGTLYIRTRVLGNYVLSANELVEDVEEVPSEETETPSEETEADKDNPSTGR